MAILLTVMAVSGMEEPVEVEMLHGDMFSEPAVLGAHPKSGQGTRSDVGEGASTVRSPIPMAHPD